jgi:hypothetical protein
MTPLDIIGIVLLLAGLFLAIGVYLVPYVRHKPAGLVVGIVMLVVGVAVLSGAVQIGQPAQIVGNNGVPTVAVQDLKAISPDTYVVSSTSLSLDVHVSYNTTSHLISAPAGGVVQFSFQLVRTDTNTSTAIFNVVGQNILVANNSASTTSNADYLIQKFNNGTTSMTINKAQDQTSTLVSVAAASIATVNVTLTLSSTAIGNLYSNAGSDTAAIGSSVSLGVIQVAGQTISMDVVLTSIT